MSTLTKPKEILKKAIEGKSLTKDEIEIIASNAQCSKLYAQKVLEGRFLEGEEIIKTNPCQSYLYAKDVIRGAWKEGEKTIAKDSFYSLNYAENVLYGRFPKGEEAIASNGHYSFAYAKSTIRGRFEKGEKAIIEGCSGQELAYYAKNIMESRWPEAEEKIIKDPAGACDYACDFEFRWPEAEAEIIKNADYSVRYANCVLNGRWPEAEENISKNSNASTKYASNLKERFELGEEIIIKDALEGNCWNLKNYLSQVLDGNRWDKLEAAIENYEGDDERLIELIETYSNSVSIKLPDFMHNRMIALAITNANDWSVKRYFSSLEEREDNEKLFLVKRFSLDRLREILSSINE